MFSDQKMNLLFILMFISFICCSVENKKAEDITTRIEEPRITNSDSVQRVIYGNIPDTLVTVKATIDTIGQIKTLEIDQSLNTKIDSMALDIVKKYRFTPAKSYSKKHPNGHPIEREAIIPIFVRKRN